MAIFYKTDVLSLLKKAGYTTYRLRKEKLLSETTIQKLRDSVLPSWNELDHICSLLDMQPGDIVGYQPAEVTTTVQVKRGFMRIGATDSSNLVEPHDFVETSSDTKQIHTKDGVIVDIKALDDKLNDLNEHFNENLKELDDLKAKYEQGLSSIKDLAEEYIGLIGGDESDSSD